MKETFLEKVETILFVVLIAMGTYGIHCYGQEATWECRAVSVITVGVGWHPYLEGAKILAMKDCEDRTHNTYKNEDCKIQKCIFRD